MSTTARAGALLCALALTVLTSACINHRARPAAARPSPSVSPSPSSSPSPSLAPSEAPSVAETGKPAAPRAPFTDDLAAVCSRTGGVSGTRAYGGRGTHPVAIFGVPEPRRIELTVNGLPAGWHTDDTTAVQLIACLDVAAVGGQVDTCTYGSGIIPDGSATSSVAILSRSYTVQVHEATTGTVLATVESVVGADKTCDALVKPQFGRLPKQYTKLSTAQITDLLRKFVVT